MWIGQEMMWRDTESWLLSLALSGSLTVAQYFVVYWMLQVDIHLF